MKNVFWLIPQRLAGRAGPTLESWSLPELRAGGIDVVLNLSEFEPAAAEFAAAQIHSAWLPLPNSYPADGDTEVACLSVLPRIYDFIHAHLTANRRVLVHCAWGRDRTGLVLAYYLARTHGVTAQTAVAQVREVRPKALTALGWEPMALRLITTLTAST